MNRKKISLGLLLLVVALAAVPGVSAVGHPGGTMPAPTDASQITSNCASCHTSGSSFGGPVETFCASCHPYPVFTPPAPGNNAPVANDQAVTTPEGTSVTINLTATDADGNTLAYTVVDNPTNGTLSGTAPDLTYTPDAGYNGSDSFTFKANDGTVDSNTATVSITVGSSILPPDDDECHCECHDHDEHDGDHDEHDGDHDEHDGGHDGHHNVSAGENNKHNEEEDD